MKGTSFTNNKRITILATSTTLISQQSYADTSFDVDVGTLNGKIQVAQSPTRNTHLRLEYNDANYDTNGETNGVDHDLDLELSSAGLLFDWPALNKSFRFT
ncbi:MAG: hypothetical protein COB94_003765, partial [Gammaproteobacteria bacterium]|nr:hypothetical protein [Gammaproteobacteria bacterium]